MRLAEILSKDVHTITSVESADVAWNRMSQQGFHHLVVVDRGRVVGVLSQRDVASAEVRRNRTVGDRMVAHVVTAGPRTLVREAANLLRGNAIGCLPVMEDGRLVGIVTVSDLLELIGHGSFLPVHQRDRQLLRRRGPRRRAVRRSGARS